MFRALDFDKLSNKYGDLEAMRILEAVEELLDEKKKRDLLRTAPKKRMRDAMMQLLSLQSQH